MTKFAALPLVALALLLGGCGTGDQNESVPAPTVITNDEAIANSGIEVPTETGSSPVETSTPAEAPSDTLPEAGTSPEELKEVPQEAGPEGPAITTPEIPAPVAD